MFDPHHLSSRSDNLVVASRCFGQRVGRMKITAFFAGKLPTSPVSFSTHLIVKSYIPIGMYKLTSSRTLIKI